MKKSRLIPALLVMASLSLSACDPGGSIAQTVTQSTPTPTPEPIPTAVPETPTPTVSPNMQGTVYTAPDKSFRIDLPDISWVIRAEDNDRKSFESPEQGSIEILHTQGEENMAAVLLPDTEDLAISMEKASGLEEETDFKILTYLSTGPGTVGVYAFIVQYLNTEKSDGVIYRLNRYYVTEDEYYGVIGSVRREDTREAIGRAMDSFAVLSGSVIATVATGQVEEETPEEAAAEAEETGTDDGETGEGSEAEGLESASYTDEELADTDQTRTIYRNSDGAPIVIRSDASAGWVDRNGMTYRFEGEQDVYDENDVDYYWHWEAGDVAFMPVEAGE